MPTNIEIKASYPDVCKLFDTVKMLRESGFLSEPTLLVQKDTFFKAGEGVLLKLRQESLADGTFSSAQLISYKRSITSGPKKSEYKKVSVEKDSVGELVELLSESNGFLGTVNKTRELSIYSSKNVKTRVHLDQVDGLGNFLEFEVLVENGVTEDDGLAQADHLIRLFGIKDEQLCSESYFSILQKSKCPVST